MVHMRDGWNIAACPIDASDDIQVAITVRGSDTAIPLDRRNQKHVGRWSIDFKVVADVFLETTGREGPKALAILDLEVHQRLHFSGTCIAQDAAAPESARTEFHAALEQTYDLLFVEELRNTRGPVLVVQSRTGIVVKLQILGDALVGKLRAEQRSLHDVSPVDTARAVHAIVPVGQGGAQRASGITCRGLDPQIVKDLLPQDLSVGDAIQGNTSGQTQVAFAREFARMASDLQYDLLGDFLD